MIQITLQALDWLRADKKSSISPTRMQYNSFPSEPAFLPTTLAILTGHRDLACVRDEKELARLPEPERKEWQTFWAEVAALLKKADRN